MKSLLFILVMVFGGMSLLYARFKHFVQEESDHSEAYSNMNGDGATENDDFFSFDANETEEVVNSKPEYFSYETLEIPTEDKQKIETVVPVVEEELPRFMFDLRQAVVYQALLNNRYINLENKINL